MTQGNESRFYKVPTTMTNHEIAALLSEFAFTQLTVGGGTFQDPFGIVIATRQSDELLSIYEHNCDEEIIMTAKVSFTRLSDEENKTLMKTIQKEARDC